MNYQIHFEGLDLDRNGPTGSASIRFRISTADGGFIATIPVHTGAREDGLEGMLARAHKSLASVFRELATQLDQMGGHYEKESTRYTPRQ